MILNLFFSQTENDNLKEGLRSFEINLNNAAEQYESKRWKWLNRSIKTLF